MALRLQWSHTSQVLDSYVWMGVIMNNGSQRFTWFPASAIAAAVAVAAVVAAAPAGPAEHIRGTVHAVEGQVVTITTKTGAVKVHLTDATAFGSIVKADRSQITDGRFVGITSEAGPDGKPRAIEVHIIADALRGHVGEGSFDWDHPAAGAHRDSKMTNGTASSKMTNGTAMAASKMTNGTVSPSSSKMTNGMASHSKMTNGTAMAGSGETLTVAYKDGSSGASQNITIPPGIPVVEIQPGTRAEVQPGVHVFVIAHRAAGGALTADRLFAGRNGTVPPM